MPLDSATSGLQVHLQRLLHSRPQLLATSSCSVPLDSATSSLQVHLQRLLHSRPPRQRDQRPPGPPLPPSFRQLLERLARQQVLRSAKPEGASHSRCQKAKRRASRACPSRAIRPFRLAVAAGAGGASLVSVRWPVKPHYLLRLASVGLSTVRAPGRRSTAPWASCAISRAGFLCPTRVCYCSTTGSTARV